jgi:hypothetical protein
MMMLIFLSPYPRGFKKYRKGGFAGALLIQSLKACASQGWLRGSSLDPKLKSLCKDALKEYNKVFIRPDDSNRKSKGLVLIGIKTYKHKKKRLKLFTDYITIDEFFDPKVIKKFRELMKKKLGEKGAEDVIAGDPVFDKENKGFGFICSYRLPEGDEAKEFHRVFLGGSGKVADRYYFNYISFKYITWIYY